MNTDLDAPATALYVTIDDLLIDHPDWRPERPTVGIAPKLADAELVTLAVIQALLGYTSEARFIRYAHTNLNQLFRYLPNRPDYNKRLRAAGTMMQHIIATLARSCPSYTDDLWLVDSTPVECGRSRETVKRSDMAGHASYGYCASHSRFFWGLRLHLIATPSGLPVAYALTSAKTDERDTALAMFDLDPALTDRARQTLMAHKGYRSANFEAELNTHGITLIRPSLKSERPRPGQRFLKPFCQIIESVNQTLKAQLDLERHGGANPPASAPASCNESSRSPPPSGTTKPPTNPAPHAHSSPTTTDGLGANHLGARRSARRSSRACARRTNDWLSPPTNRSRPDTTARAVLGNVRAMEQAVAIGTERNRLRVSDLIEIHRVLLEGTTEQRFAGVVRTDQNWIGGRGASPRNAAFVPPPPDHVPAQLDDLVAFANLDDLTAISQAAIAHAQFETIHPFGDGNGRAGRCLIHVVLRRRDMTPRLVPPISVALATNARRYVAGLVDFREGRTDDWIGSFADTVSTAAAATDRLSVDIDALLTRLVERAGTPRADSVARKIILGLPSQPIVSAESAAARHSVTPTAARAALNRLEERAVLTPTRVGRRRDREWSSDELFELLDGLEHDIVQPDDVGSGVDPHR